MFLTWCPPRRQRSSSVQSEFNTRDSLIGGFNMKIDVCFNLSKRAHLILILVFDSF